MPWSWCVKARRAIARGVLGCLLTGSVVCAHPLSMSSAEIDITRTNITVRLKVLAEDLVLFHDLQADADTRVSAPALRSAAHMHEAFVRQNLHLRGTTGARLVGEVKQRDVSGIPDAGILQADLMKHAVAYTLVYPLDTPPRFLTILQYFGGEQAIIPAVMDLTLMQEGVWLDKPLQVGARRPYTVALDWEKPAQAPANWQALRKQRAAEQERRLGIASYNEVYSYLYLDHQGLRHELLIPLLSLEGYLPIPRADPEWISVAEQEALSTALGTFFRKDRGVEINGIAVSAEVQRVQFFGLDALDLAIDAAPVPLNVYQGRVGIILDYPSTHAPGELRLRWGPFPPAIASLRSLLYIDGEPVKEHLFSPDQPDWSWTAGPESPPHAALPLPRLMDVPARIQPRYLLSGLLAVGACLLFRARKRLAALGLIILLVPVAGYFPLWQAARVSCTDEEAAELSRRLLQRVYGAFRERDEDAVYDELADCVRGELLETLYGEVTGGLVLEGQGGARARVEDLAIHAVEPGARASLDRGHAGFDCRCRWTVSGTVEHWGHIHTRLNSYDAVFAIASGPHGWRMTDVRFDRAEAVGTRTGLRK